MRELRKKYNMTQSEFAKFTGIPYRSIQNWEYGKRKPPEYVYDLVKFKLEHTFKNL